MAAADRIRKERKRRHSQDYGVYNAGAFAREGGRDDGVQVEAGPPRSGFCGCGLFYLGTAASVLEGAGGGLAVVADRLPGVVVARRADSLDGVAGKRGSLSGWNARPESGGDASAVWRAADRQLVDLRVGDAERADCGGQRGVFSQPPGERGSGLPFFPRKTAPASMGGGFVGWGGSCVAGGCAGQGSLGSLDAGVLFRILWSS